MFVRNFSGIQIAKSSHPTAHSTPTNQHRLSTYSATGSGKLVGDGHTTSGGTLRNRNVSTFSPAHANTGGNELLLRATTKREATMREQLFAKVRLVVLWVRF